ncbi:WXG100 family type VII secretion target [Streptomyces sp. NPDC048604]|uniref:WXG100 family type VII secretion target n=1 Tax=Streptomyces sp. NPDC048604 TaxID=3365578 RepID=UPI00371F6D3A
MPEEFDGASLDALHAMIALARPGELTTTGEALSKAAPKLAEIAKDLRHHIARVAWEGAAGDAFRTWGADLVAQTLLLCDYTKTAATELTRAGQALKEAQTALPKPTGTCFTDPAMEAARTAAETGPKLQEALHQMERLSSYYRVAKQNLDAAREPRFLPIGDHLDAAERPYPARVDGSATSSASSSPWHESGGSLRDTTVPSQTNEYLRRLDLGGELHLDSAGRVAREDVLTPSPVRVPSDRLQPPVSEAMPPLFAPGGTVGPQTGGARGGVEPGGVSARATGHRDGSTDLRKVLTPEGRSGAGSGRFPGTVIGDTALGSGAGRQPGSGSSVMPSPRPAASDRTSAVGRSTLPGGAGFVPPMAPVAGAGDRRSSGARPAYLVEDTEVWTAGQRRVVPPVID